MQRALILIAAVSLTLPACFSKTDDGTGDGGTTRYYGDPVPLESLGSELGAAACERIFACCEQAAIDEMFGQSGVTELQCVAFYEALVADYLLPSWQASIAAGRAAYDARAGGACIASIQNASCGGIGEAIGEGTNACDDMLTPLVGPEGACESNEECIDASCEWGDGEMGTCRPFVGRDQPCDGGAQCADGLYCRWDDGTGTSTCVPLEPVGGSCDWDGECESGNCVDTRCAAPTTNMCGG